MLPRKVGPGLALNSIEAITSICLNLSRREAYRLISIALTALSPARTGFHGRAHGQPPGQARGSPALGSWGLLPGAGGRGPLRSTCYMSRGNRGT